jgi:hypothetical protein
MHVLIAGAIWIGVASAPPPPPPAEAPPQAEPTPLIDSPTLKKLAEKALSAQGLSEHNLPSELWDALIERVMEAISWRHRFQALELDLADLHKQVDELRRFVADHQQFGDDFASYREVIAETKRLTDVQIALKRRQEKLERDRKREEARANREAAAAKKKQAKEASERLTKLGFSAIGQDVYLSKSAYSYSSRTAAQQPAYFQPGPNGEMVEMQPMSGGDSQGEVDYSKMTISGSLLNAAKITRNLGVAFVFRDAHGNQIGQETVVIENARPDVPYPFTGELIMASDHAFSSMTSWVLFADTAPPATTITPPSAPATP